MSGLVQWSSCAKRKPSKKVGSKPNPQRQRMLAARKRKLRLSAYKAFRRIAEARDAAEE